MRNLLLLGAVLLLGACGREDTSTPAATNVGGKAPGLVNYAGAGRDRMCLADGGRAAFITYAASGDAKCNVQGTLQGTGDQLTLVPNGDAACRIEVRRLGDHVTLGSVSDGCAYYCAPDTSFEGRAFSRTAPSEPALDFAGDPLC